MKPATPPRNSNSEENSPNKNVHLPADEETLAIRDLLAGLDPGDLTICVAFLQQSVGDPQLNCNQPETLSDLERRVYLPQAARKRFFGILSRLITGQEGISRLEIAFIRQIWHEIRGDWEQTVGSPLHCSVT